MNDLSETPIHHCEWSKDVLSITFSGPFLYVFHPGHVNTTVDIYAPFCPYHAAGIFYSRSSVSETDLWKCALSKDHSLTKTERTYALKGAGIHVSAKNPQVITPFPQAGIQVNILGHGDGTVFAPRIDKMMFSLSVPRPKYIYPLYYDFVEVIRGYKTTPSYKYLYYCTGLRFLYEWNSQYPINLTIPSGDAVDITPPVFGQLPRPWSADIEVRYAGCDLADENDPHSDARSCFASLVNLAGVEHWLNYGDGHGSPTNLCHTPPIDPHATAPGPCECLGPVHLHTGGDCYAPVMVAGLD
jgi:hypothetical protein